MSGSEISGKIKTYLHATDEVNDLSSELQKKRKTVKPLAEEIMSCMNESNLTVVRYMHHARGPRDVILQKRIKKPSLTKVRVMSCLREYEGKHMDENSMTEIIKKLTAPTDEVAYSLKINKLSLKDESIAEV